MVWGVFLSGFQVLSVQLHCKSQVSDFFYCHLEILGGIGKKNTLLDGLLISFQVFLLGVFFALTSPLASKSTLKCLN